jgi:hypothetical protein
MLVHHMRMLTHFPRPVAIVMDFVLYWFVYAPMFVVWMLVDHDGYDAMVDEADAWALRRDALGDRAVAESIKRVVTRADETRRLTSEMRSIRTTLQHEDVREWWDGMIAALESAEGHDREAVEKLRQV